MKEFLPFRTGSVRTRAVPAAKVGGMEGFTLIELMIVVAIVAILTAIAYPAYTKYIARTHRVAAESCLAQYSAYMERFYTTNLRYDQDSSGTATALPTLDCESTSQTGSDYTYDFKANTLTSSTYTVEAKPKGAQATRDAVCGTLSLNQAGTRDKSGTNTVSQCW